MPISMGFPGLNLHCSAANRRDRRIGLSCKEFRFRNARAQPDEPVVRVIFDADWIRAETIVHECVCLFVGLEGVDLELHLVASGSAKYIDTVIPWWTHQ